MHPVLCKVGSIALYSWGFFVALGFLAAIYVAILNSKRENLSADQVIDISIYTFLSAIIGARLVYVMAFWSEFKNNLISIFAVWEGGLVFYGGLIGVLVVLFWYSKKHKISILKIFDLLAPSAAVGYSIGRIGCFMRGCCFGNETTVPWAVHFPEISGLRHATQLYSSLAGLLIFIVLLFIRDQKKYDGQIFAWGLLLYSTYRFLVEFLRYSPMYFMALSPSQWASIFVFIFSVGYIVYKKMNNSL